MTPRFLFSLLIICIFALSCSESPQPTGESRLELEASIVAGQPVADIKVVRISDSDEGNQLELVADAKVKMLSMGKVYELTPAVERTGYYHYPGDDLEIVVGREYFLWVEYENQVAVTARVVGEPTPGAGRGTSGDAEYYVAKN